MGARARCKNGREIYRNPMVHVIDSNVKGSPASTGF
jgi:hypothetical protein